MEKKIKNRKVKKVKKAAKPAKVLVKKNTKAIKKSFKKIKPLINKKNKIILKKKSAAKIIEKKKVIAKNKIVVNNSVKKIAQAKKTARHKSKKVSSRQDIEKFPAESLFKARIKVIGIGGGGGSIVSEIGRSLEKATFVVADTDIRALKKKSGIKYFWFGQELTHGLGTGVNVDLAKQAAESAKEKMSTTFKDQDIVIFIASLGGGLGSGATQVFAEAAREFGGITFGIFTMPFKFEGKNKQRIAQNALKILRKSLNVSLVIPNEKIFKIIDANTAITDAFSIVNKSLIESLESLIDLIYNPGIINIDFADLRTILRGRGNAAFLNTVEEFGKNRAELICEKVLVNPLLQNSSFQAEKILFNIAGSDNLSMFEVEKISRHISELNPKAKIIFGISKNSKLKNKIKTTILMTGGQVQEESLIVEELQDKKEKNIKIIIAEEIKEEPKKEIEVVAETREIKEIKKEGKKPKIKIEKPKKPKVKTKKPVKKDKIKPAKKPKDKNKKISGNNKEKEESPASSIPVFEIPVLPVPVATKNRMNIIETDSLANKKNIRRSGLEIRKAEEQEEKKRMAQEKEWEIPAFLRRVKFKN